MSTQLEVGDTIPLQAQLDDGATGKFVHAEVVIPGGPTLFDGLLDHVANGLYRNLSLAMPDVPVVSAQYSVLQDDMETISSSYSVDAEDFVRFKPEDITILPPGIVAAVRAEVSDETAAMGQAELNDLEVEADVQPDVQIEVRELKIKTTVAQDLRATAESAEIAVDGPVC